MIINCTGEDLPQGLMDLIVKDNPDFDRSIIRIYTKQQVINSKLTKALNHAQAKLSGIAAEYPACEIYSLNGT